MSYQHLTLEERYCLAEFREKGLSIRAIARMLKRSPSTISRELRRNRGKRGYHPYGAYSKAKHRRRMPRRLLKGIEGEKLEYVMRALSEWHWSPEQIAGRWRKEHPDTVLSGHVFYLLCDASILHLMGGLHKVWDGLGKGAATKTPTDCCDISFPGVVTFWTYHKRSLSASLI